MNNDVLTYVFNEFWPICLTKLTYRNNDVLTYVLNEFWPICLTKVGGAKKPRTNFALILKKLYENGSLGFHW